MQRFPRRNRGLALALLTLALAAGPSATGAKTPAIPDIAGIYEMDGDTTVEGQPDRFHVTGKLVIRQEGANCTLSVDGSFRRVEGTSGPSAISLIGNGEAKLVGHKFFGTAILQTIMSDVPGIDVSAPYMPKKFGPKLDAMAEGEVIEDGMLLFEIRSTVIGEGFTLPEGRTTVVRATRVARSPFELKKKE